MKVVCERGPAVPTMDTETLLGVYSPVNCAFLKNSSILHLSAGSGVFEASRV